MQISIKYVCLCTIYGIFTVSSFFFRRRLSAWFVEQYTTVSAYFCTSGTFRWKTANALLSLQEGEWVVTGEMCEMCQWQISHSVKHGPKLQNSQQVITACTMLSVFLFFDTTARKPCPLPKSFCLPMPIHVGSLVEDRVAVTLCQQTQFWAVFFNWAHVSPLVFALISPDLLEVCFNLPALLSPCGFSPFLVMLPAGLQRIHLIHPRFCIFTSWQMGIWLFLSNRLPLETFLGYLIFGLCLGHLLVKVWSLQMVVLVTLHGSDPYRKTGFTLVVDILFFLWSDYALEFQMVPSMSGLVDPVFQGHEGLSRHLRWLYFLDEMACLFDVFSLE